MAQQAVLHFRAPGLTLADVQEWVLKAKAGGAVGDTPVIVLPANARHDERLAVGTAFTRTRLPDQAAPGPKPAAKSGRRGARRGTPGRR